MSETNAYKEYYGAALMPMHKCGTYEFGEPKYLYEIPPLEVWQKKEIGGYKFTGFSIERVKEMYWLYAHHGPNFGLVGFLKKDIPELPDFTSLSLEDESPIIGQ